MGVEEAGLEYSLTQLKAAEATTSRDRLDRYGILNALWPHLDTKLNGNGRINLHVLVSNACFDYTALGKS